MAEKIEILKPEKVPTYTSEVEDKINEIIELINPIAHYTEELINPWKETPFECGGCGGKVIRSEKIMKCSQCKFEFAYEGEASNCDQQPQKKLSIRYEELKSVMERVKPMFENGGERGLTTFDVITPITTDDESEIFHVLIR